MSDKAAHVAAVAEAMGDVWASRFNDEDGSTSSYVRSVDDLATVAVETLTPLIAAERDALAAENARLRAQVQAVEATLDNRYHGGDCHSWDKFRSVDGPHPCDCWRADLLAALIAPEHVISKPEPGDPLPSRCTCGWIGTDGAVEIHFIRNLRAALATTEPGEGS